MRLWHYKLLDSLPTLQFNGQRRELVAILHDWRDKGTTNHLLINRVMDYPKSEFVCYFDVYSRYFYIRNGFPIPQKSAEEFHDFDDHTDFDGGLYSDWMNDEYLRVCMANLYEKYKFGKGASAVSEIEWKKLILKYKEITGTDYIL